jgi:hypothetical protein
MTAVLIHSPSDEPRRRDRLYQGDIFVLPPTRASLALRDLAAGMLAEAFAPHEPELAQFHMPVGQYAAILAELKPRFIHHPTCKELIREILVEHGCDPEDTYFDVPRLRTSTSDGYLTTGIAYAFHPHRDTWYSAALCQLNWWLPVYDLSPDNGMAFHPDYWSRPLPNTSARYDYQRWNATSRFDAAKHIGKDTREQPKPLVDVPAQPDIRVVPPVGGIVLFSAAQLHSSLPNHSGRTRVSIDFRTVSRADVEAARGAPNVDSHCTGTALGDFLRASDGSRLPDELIRRYLPGHPVPARIPAEA